MCLRGIFEMVFHPKLCVLLELLLLGVHNVVQEGFVCCLANTTSIAQLASLTKMVSWGPESTFLWGRGAPQQQLQDLCE
jgi:hypothetical protein